MKIFTFMCLLALFSSCSAVDCITCSNVNNYPNTTICKDTYETSINGGDASWQVYKEEALENGCTEKE